MPDRSNVSEGSTSHISGSESYEMCPGYRGSEDDGCSDLRHDLGSRKYSVASTTMLATTALGYGAKVLGRSVNRTTHVPANVGPVRMPPGHPGMPARMSVLMFPARGRVARFVEPRVSSCVLSSDDTLFSASSLRPIRGSF